MAEPKPLADCREQDLTNHHALVYGRARVWYSVGGETAWHWSNDAWWKAMWYPHRGSPSNSGAWGLYGGSHGYTGPGDAELTHFLPMPAPPGVRGTYKDVTEGGQE